jgi:1-deoxy-D-xylulose-5-phosphate synthase
LDGPQLLHVITTKGKGFAPAEADPIGYHALGKLESQTRALNLVEKTPSPKYQDIFGQWLCDMAAEDSKLIAITPAMGEGSGMVTFSQRFPERFLDVAIAEQHAVTLAAGLACDGMKPVVAIYSTFLQRAYDQLIHDVALQNLDVLFAIDRAGLVGEDGATHAGSFDLSFLRCIPNMVVMAPSDENECRQMLFTGYRHNGPAAVRYPRGQGPKAQVLREMTQLPLGKGIIRRQGETIAILNFGALLDRAMDAAQQLNATVADMRFVKPIDEALILELAEKHTLLVTLEENTLQGGAGSAVSELLSAHGVTLPVLHLGLPDTFLNHGKHTDLLNDCGLSVTGIMASIRARIARISTPAATPKSLTF